MTARGWTAASIAALATTNPGAACMVETADDLKNLQPLNLSGAVVQSIDARWECVIVVDSTITPARFGRVRVTTQP